MTHAYNELYLNAAQHCLARMFDYGVNSLNFSCRQLFSMFIMSGYAKSFGEGDCTLLAGKSGVELAWEILDRLHISHPDTCGEQNFARSHEYWAGWTLAYLQWYSGLTFMDIEKYITIEAILEMYYPYHEMDQMQLVDKCLEIYATNHTQTNLKLWRQKAGYSQSELARLANIPLRTIQQYEQRQKNINNAKAEYVLRLSRCLFCNMEDLLEIG